MSLKPSAEAIPLQGANPNFKPTVEAIRAQLGEEKKAKEISDSQVKQD
jgi:hypothetical protein